MPESGILHADLDAFYASVEQRDDPALRGRPVIVGGGVVLAASYEARACGVRSAMGGRQALRLCPDAVVVAPRVGVYTQASKDVFAIFEDTTPLVEPISVDEAFLDVRGLTKISGPPAEIAQRLRARVHNEVGLAITVGIAPTKFLAKVASGVAKPDGLLVVPVGGELAFLRPLPVERLWGVGPKTAARLHDRGLFTVADVADLNERGLTAMLGPASGRQLYALARNHDPRAVTVGRRRRSIGSQSALGFRRVTIDEVETRLISLVERVCLRLRKAHRMCHTVTLRMRFHDFARATRSHTLPRPTAETATILTALQALLHAETSLIADRGLSLVGVTLANLDDDAAIQLELPYDRIAQRDLDVAVDLVRDRFGSSSLTRGVLIGTDPGITVPLLPD